MKIKLTHSEAMEKIKELQTICKKIRAERDYYKEELSLRSKQLQAYANAKKSDFDLPDFLRGFRK